MIAPKLRFREFTDEWRAKKLGNFAKTFSGGTPSSSNKSFYVGEIPFIKSGEISTNKTAQAISEEALKTSSAKMVQRGDILYALYGATSGQVAISQINGAINQAVLCIRPEANNYFIYSVLESKKSVILSTHLQGGQGNLSANIIKNLEIKLPSLTEQEKIAEFLSAVDARIDAASRKLELLRDYKTAVSQKIFSREIRFPGFTDEWKPAKISDLVESIVPPIKILTKDFRQNGAYPIVDQGKQLIAGYTDDKRALIGPGKYVIFGDHTETLKFVDFPFTQGADGLKILRVTQEDISPKFLYYGFSRNYIFEGNYKRHWTTARETMITVPSLNEQTKIAKFLAAVDNKIVVERDMISEMKRFKKSLLQRMMI